MGSSLAAGELRAAYEAWCAAHDHERLSMPKFATELKRLGHEVEELRTYPIPRSAPRCVVPSASAQSDPRAWIALQQQARFDDFLHEFNVERPREAIAMKCPAEVYSRAGTLSGL